MTVSTSITPRKAPPRPVTSAAPALETSMVSRASLRVARLPMTGSRGSGTPPTTSIRPSWRREGHWTGRFRASTTTACWWPTSSIRASTSRAASPGCAMTASASGTSSTRRSVSCLRPAPEPMNSSTNASAGSARIRSGVSYCTMRAPSAKTTIQSPSFTASSKSCVTMTMVFCSSAWMRISSSCRRWRVIGSTAPNGSSMSSTGGSAASARASPTRCCWPPESSFG